jgi:glucose/mannose-6-phosphate isomerase
MQLTEDMIRQIDRSDMRGAILSTPAQMRDALMRANAGLASGLPGGYSNLLLGGLGGSAIGGDLVRAYLGNDLSVPFEIVRGYDLPASASEKSLIVISSYSGNTEESLSVFEQAIAKGLKPVCVTAGGRLLEQANKHGLTHIVLPTGFQPRAALAYSFVSVLMIAQAAGLTKGQEELITDCADRVESLSVTFSQDNGEALRIASKLVDGIPVIYSASDVIGAINVRWRGQIQENAKHLAFGNVLPEMNHNEILAWQYPADMISKFKVIFMRSREDEHRRVQRRFEVLEEVLREAGLEVMHVNATGKNRLERMFSLITLGDWVSYYLAILTNTDPTPIPAIDRLKAALA